MTGKFYATVCSAAMACMFALPASAQVITSDEILKRFQLQAESNANSKLQTRGVVLDYNEEPSETAQPSVVSRVPAPAPAIESVAAPEPTTTAVAERTPAPVTPAPFKQAEPIPAPVVAATTERAVLDYTPGTSAPVYESVDLAVNEPEEAEAVAVPVAIAPPSVSVATYESGTSTQIFDSVDVVATEPVFEPLVAPEPKVIAASVSTQTVLPQEPVPAAANSTYQAVSEEERVYLEVYFEWNSASLRPDAIAQLSELCSAILAVPAGNAFQIIGHTDKSGTSDYNLYLSEARAREVKRHLSDECDIPAQNLLATGEGENQAPAGTPSVSPEERRVEVQLIS